MRLPGFESEVERAEGKEGIVSRNRGVDRAGLDSGREKQHKIRKGKLVKT